MNMRIFLSIRVILLPVVIISCHDDIACFPRKSPACYLVRAMRRSCAGRFGLRGRSPLSAHDSGSGSACAKVIILFCLNEGMRFLFHLICENRRMVEFVARCRHLAACGLPGEALPPLVVICAMYAPCGFSLSSGI